MDKFDARAAFAPLRVASVMRWGHPAPELTPCRKAPLFQRIRGVAFR